MNNVVVLGVLTVVEVLALVAVLAVYLIAIVAKLRNVADTLAKIAFGVRALEVQIQGVGPALQTLNQTLSALDSALPGLASKAEAAAARR